MILTGVILFGAIAFGVGFIAYSILQDTKEKEKERDEELKEEESLLVYYSDTYNNLALIYGDFQDILCHGAPEAALNEYLAFNLGEPESTDIVLVGEL